MQRSQPLAASAAALVVESHNWLHASLPKTGTPGQQKALLQPQASKHMITQDRVSGETKNPFRSKRHRHGIASKENALRFGVGVLVSQQRALPLFEFKNVTNTHLSVSPKFRSSIGNPLIPQKAQLVLRVSLWFLQTFRQLWVAKRVPKRSKQHKG